MTANSESKLLPCPFCGSANISSGEVLGTRPGTSHSFKQTCCINCGACGPETVCSDIYDDAPPNNAWNNRARVE